MKISIRLKGDEDLSLKSDLEGWYQIEVNTAREYGINIKDYKLVGVTCGMAERGVTPRHSMKFVDAYELELERLKPIYPNYDSEFIKEKNGTTTHILTTYVRVLWEGVYYLDYIRTVRGSFPYQDMKDVVDEHYREFINMVYKRFYFKDPNICKEMKVDEDQTDEFLRLISKINSRYI